MALPRDVFGARLPYPGQEGYEEFDIDKVIPIVVKIVKENIKELLNVQTLTPGSFPV